MDKWGDILCPSCGKKELHVWQFSADCRGNQGSEGANCSCGYEPKDELLTEALRQLWGDPKPEIKKESRRSKSIVADIESAHLIQTLLPQKNKELIRLEKDAEHCKKVIQEIKDELKFRGDE